MFLKSQIVEKIGERIPKLYLSLEGEMNRFILNIWRAAPLLYFQKNIIRQKKVYNVLSGRKRKNNLYVP